MNYKDIVYPALFPFVADELQLYRFINKHKLWRTDIYISYNYQEIHFELLRSYVASEYLKSCQEEISNVKEQAELIDVFNKSHYGKYYKYFLCLALREGYDTIEKFKEWLKTDRNFIFLYNRKQNYIREFNKTYKTIIIPLIPPFSELDNKINRMYGLAPSFYDEKRIFNESVKHLVEGGKIFVLDETSRERIQKFKNENIERVTEEMFRKTIKPKPKNEFLGYKKWL